MALSVTHANVTSGTVNNDVEVDLHDWNAAHTITGGEALSKVDDTNVTLTLGGTPTTALLLATSITAGWTGTLAAARLNSNVVQSVVNDTNVTGSVSAQALTLGWTGTLAAARLNSNVVQSIVNDTNVTGSVSAQALTLGWTGTLAASRGGTGLSSLGAGVATFLGTPSSANLAAALTNETGSGAVVFGTSPTITTATINTPTINTATINTPNIVGTSTNDSAAAGSVGEEMICGGAALASATVTMTIATPCVVTWTSNTLTNFCCITFTTTGALPTGVTSGTTYYVGNLSGNTFNISTSVANAIAGTYVATSGTQSGTHTGTNSANLTSSAAKDVGGLSLTAGDWDIAAAVFREPGATTNFTLAATSINTVSNTLNSTPGRGFLIRYGAGGVVPAAGFGGETIGPSRVSISATTTYFINAFDTFTVSTDSAYGVIRARRIR